MPTTRLLPRPSFLVAFVLICLCHTARALMAGDEQGTPPDSPPARVDPNTTTSAWAGVGSLVVNGNAYSAAAIHPRYVLTAAHVVQGAQPSNVVFKLNFGGDLTHEIPAEAVFVHPSFVSFGNPNLANDLAVVELSANMPAGTPVYALCHSAISLAALPQSNPIITGVGYGASGFGDVGISVGGDARRKRIGQNRIDNLGALFADPVVFNKLFVFDFDGGSAPNALGGAGLGNDKETTFAGGDSGSPSFAACEGGNKVVGVNTFVMYFSGGPAISGVFGTGGGGNLVYPYLGWINSIVPTTSDSGNSEIPMLPPWGIAAAAGALIVAARRLAHRRG